MTKLDELYFDIEADVDNVAKKMKKVVFPVDEDYKDPNFLLLYSCSKQYNVLRKVCRNIINVIKDSNVKHKRSHIESFTMLLNSIPCYDFDNLEICPEAENLKLKYIKYIKAEKIDLNTL